MFSGNIGLGCKMILSTTSGDSVSPRDEVVEGEQKILDNIPIASVISGLLFLSAFKLLPHEEAEEDR